MQCRAEQPSGPERVRLRVRNQAEGRLNADSNYRLLRSSFVVLPALQVQLKSKTILIDLVYLHTRRNRARARVRSAPTCLLSLSFLVRVSPALDHRVSETQSEDRNPCSESHLTLLPFETAACTCPARSGPNSRKRTWCIRPWQGLTRPNALTKMNPLGSRSKFFTTRM